MDKFTTKTAIFEVSHDFLKDLLNLPFGTRIKYVDGGEHPDRSFDVYITDESFKERSHPIRIKPTWFKRDAVGVHDWGFPGEERKDPYKGE